MQVDEVFKSRCKNRCKNLCLIDWVVLLTSPWGPYLYAALRSHNQTRLESYFQTKQNLYRKQTLTIIETNSKLSILGDRYTTTISLIIPTSSSTIIGISSSIGIGSCQYQHQQPSTTFPGHDYILLLYHRYHKPSATPLSTSYYFLICRYKLH